MPSTLDLGIFFPQRVSPTDYWGQAQCDGKYDLDYENNDEYP